jgi:hypothetical protein
MVICINMMIFVYSSKFILYFTIICNYFLDRFEKLKYNQDISRIVRMFCIRHEID